jgi:DeoR/GlpR family transcriptional regulator of sugar metabolism
MRYGRLYAIERRLGALLKLLRAGKYSAPELAQQLGVSVPTVSRDITALREQGYVIRPVRGASEWSYVLETGSRSPKLRRKAGVDV